MCVRTCVRVCMCMCVYVCEIYYRQSGQLIIENTRHYVRYSSKNAFYSPLTRDITM